MPTDETGDAGRSSPHEGGGFVSVLHGSQSEAMAARTVLEALGFHPYTENQFIKTIDPFITGGMVFDVHLVVPASEARAAAEALREARSAARVGGEEPRPESALEGSDVEATGDALRDTADAREDRETEAEKLDRAGVRLRWVTLLYLCVSEFIVFVNWAAGLIALLPYTLFAADYLVRVRRAQVRPRRHRLTVGGIAAVAVLTLISLLVVASGVLG